MSIDFEAIRQAHSLLDIVSSDTGRPLRRGTSVHCIWPENHAHGDTKKPSMVVYEDHVYCFTERRRGDVMDYWAATRNVTQDEARRQLSGGEPPMISTSSFAPRVAQAAKPSQSKFDPERLRLAHEEAWRYYTFVPRRPLIGKEGQPVQSLHARAVEYLAGRRLTIAGLEAHIGHRLVGHAPKEVDGLYKYLTTPPPPPVRPSVAPDPRPFSDAELDAAGLVALGRGGGLIDYFRHRVVFPIRDEHGIVGFVGRRDLYPDRANMTAVEAEQWASSHAIRELPPKYINTRETVLYDKKKVLYWPVGLARPGDRVVVVEGVIDALAVAVASLEGGRLSGGRERVVPVAACGKSMSSAQWQAIARTEPSRVALGLDADASSRDWADLVAGARQADIEHLALIDWRPSTTSPAKDPAEVLQTHDAGAVMDRLKASTLLSSPGHSSRVTRSAAGAEEMSADLPAPPPGPDLGLST